MCPPDKNWFPLPYRTIMIPTGMSCCPLWLPKVNMQSIVMVETQYLDFFCLFFISIFPGVCYIQDNLYMKENRKKQSCCHLIKFVLTLTLLSNICTLSLYPSLIERSAH